MANKVPSWARYRPADIAAVSCGTCTFFLHDRVCSMFDAPVESSMVCDEWVDINQQDAVTKKAPHVHERQIDEQHPPVKHTATPRDTAMREGRSKELWDATSEMLEPTFRGVQKAAPDHGDGAMICLYPTREVQEALAVEGGLDPEDIHLTLVFLGPAADLSEENLGSIRSRLAKVAASTAPLTGKVSGGGSFAGDGEKVPVYATPRVPGLHQLRAKFADLSASEFPFLPHITRTYVAPGDEDTVPDPLGVPLDFDSIHLKVGGKRKSYPLRGTIHKASGALYLMSHGMTRYNAPGQSRDRVQSWKGIPINAQGRKESAQLGKFLASKNVDELHASDIVRAKQTADIAGRHADLPVRGSPKYRPWNLGDFAGHSSEEVIPKLKPFMTEKPDEPVDRHGESFNDFKERFIPALEALLKKADQGKTIALVTHSRNIELAQGWMAGKRRKINTRAISSDDIDPASVFLITDGKISELEDLFKATQANTVSLRLRVGGVSRIPSGERVYRMFTRDGHYVGRTQATKQRALKGDTLRLNTKHLTLTENGDPYWLSPVVEGQSPDAPHSFRQLTALAGVAEGELRGANEFGSAKGDTVATTNTNNTWNAPGPAGQIPDPGDDQHLADMLDQDLEGVEYDDEVTGRQRSPGPTTAAMRKNQPSLSSVHVPSALGNISTAYTAAGRRNKLLTLDPDKPSLAILKADTVKQIVYGVVLEPNRVDTQDDWVHPDDIEDAAHRYLKKVARGQAKVHTLQHRTTAFFKNKPGLAPVESFIAPCDFKYDGSDEQVLKGSWVMGIHVERQQDWDDVLDGKYDGLSIGGSGVRDHAAQFPTAEVPHMWIGPTQASDWALQPPYTG